ncbi:MAG: diguanylate cyclase domain-containing protein [Parashewanella sp.]
MSYLYLSQMKSNKRLSRYLLTVVAAILACATVVVSANTIDSEIQQAQATLNSNLMLTKKKLVDLKNKMQLMTNEQKSQFYFIKGIAHIYESEHVKAQQSFDTAIETTSNHILLSQIYGSKSTSYLSVRNYSAALHFAEVELSQIAHINDGRIMRSAYLRVVNLLTSLGAKEQALKYVNKVLKLTNESTQRDTCIAKTFFTLNLNEAGDKEKQLQEFIQNREFCQEINYPTAIAIIDRSLGEIKLDMGDADAAIPHLNSAIHGYSALNFESEIFMVNALLAKSHLVLNKYELAKKYANNVIKQKNDPSFYEAKHLAHQTLGEIYASQGDFEQAYYHGQKEHFYQSWLYDDEKMKSLAREAAKFDYGELERQIIFAENSSYGFSGKEAVHLEKMAEKDLATGRWQGVSIAFILLSVFLSGLALRFYRRWRVDDLTGLTHRYFVKKQADAQFNGAMTERVAYSVITFNIDKLKQINETFDHDCGDWVITQVVKEAKKACSNHGLFTRVNFADFHLFLTNCDMNEATEIAQRMQDGFASLDCQKQISRDFKVTASFGVAESTIEWNELSTDRMVHRADLALKEARALGGNTIVKYSNLLAEQQDDSSKQQQFVQFIDPKRMKPFTKRN